MHLSAPRSVVRSFLQISFLLVAAALAAAGARADEARKLALIDEMFTITHVDTMMQQAMQQTMAMQKAQLAKLHPDGANQAMEDELFDRVTKIATDTISWDKIKPDMVKLYADNFTEEELSASLDFYKTPAGQAILTKMPALMSSSMQIVQARMADMMPKIQQAAKEVMAKYPPAKGTPKAGAKASPTHG